MNYSISIKKSTKKDFSKLPKKARIQLIEAIRNLAKPDHDLDIKPIKNMPNVFRLRVGKYRILYYQDDKNRSITVWRVAHRSIAYRAL